MVTVAPVGIGTGDGLPRGSAVGFGMAEAVEAGKTNCVAIADIKFAGAGETDAGSTDIGSTAVAVTDGSAATPVAVCEASAAGIEGCAGGIKG
jgi:hypothetical protein